AAPTSCSGSKRRSLNSLKNCLDRWVHFILSSRQQALRLLELMSDDEIAKVAIPVLLSSVLNKSQL
ncbi:hypothetical protein ACSETY_05090, partial [Pseudomonas aeruginosa]